MSRQQQHSAAIFTDNDGGVRIANGKISVYNNNYGDNIHNRYNHNNTTTTTITTNHYNYYQSSLHENRIYLHDTNVTQFINSTLYSQNGSRLFQLLYLMLVH